MNRTISFRDFVVSMSHFFNRILIIYLTAIKSSYVESLFHFHWVGIFNFVMFYTIFVMCLIQRLYILKMYFDVYDCIIIFIRTDSKSFILPRIIVNREGVHLAISVISYQSHFFLILFCYCKFVLPGQGFHFRTLNKQFLSFSGFFGCWYYHQKRKSLVLVQKEECYHFCWLYLLDKTLLLLFYVQSCMHPL